MICLTLLAACTVSSQADEPAPSPAEATPIAKPSADGMLRTYPGFPDIQIQEGRTTFAHDRGNITPVLGYLVGGVKADEADLLRAWVALKKGWGEEGEFGDAAVIETVNRFVVREAFDEQPHFNGRLGFVSFEAPKTEIIENDHGRWVVFTGMGQTFVSQRGAHFVRAAHIFDAKTGARPDSPIPGMPATVTWSESNGQPSEPWNHPPAKK